LVVVQVGASEGEQVERAMEHDGGGTADMGEGDGGDAAGGTEDGEAGMSSMSDVNNGLDDVMSWSDINDENLHGRLWHGVLGLVLGAWGSATWLLGGRGVKREILPELVCGGWW